jgi:hypothetical protein
MNRTRSLFWLGCFVALGSASAPISAPAGELLRLEGKSIRLHTDLASAEEARQLVASFDAAVPQWIKFWNLPDGALGDWKVDACVIRDKAEFERQGLLPPQVPDFPFGYALGNRVWVRAQQSEYYTRHLLLHEGVHSLAFSVFKGAGPTWFMEGTAELLATHSGAGQAVVINQVPTSRDDVPYWGRFKLMNQLRDNSNVPTLESVMRYQPDLKGDVATYGWSWAAAMLLDSYPEYREAFFAAARDGSDDGPRFNRRLRKSLDKDWPIVAARWELMCHDLDYGFDWSRERVKLGVSDPMWDGRPRSVNVSADRGWQSVGVRIPGGAKVRLSPEGRITLAEKPKPWVSEPAGITFQYHRGRPLGQLLVCVLPNAIDANAKLLKALNVQPIVQATTIEVPSFSWLLMRVNDATGELGDNSGEYRVNVSLDR